MVLLVTVSAPRTTLLFLAIGIVAAAQSANIIRIGDAPPLVMAAWRLTLAVLLLLPLTGRSMKSLIALTRWEWLLLLVGGGMLAGHLITWIAAVQNTTVANATLFFSISPLTTALMAHFIFGEQLTKRLFISIGLGLSGVALIGWDDCQINSGRLTGDLLSLLSVLFFTSYLLIGKRLQRVCATPVYVTAIYLIAGLSCMVSVFIGQYPLIDYSGRNWIAFLLLALVPMIGHTALNNALRYIDAGRVSAATMAEPPIAGLVAYLAWNEFPTISAIMGYFVIVGSVLVLVLDYSTEEKRARLVASEVPTVE
jgi:drug/metabolite transporter (DMT)-like permease